MANLITSSMLPTLASCIRQNINESEEDTLFKVQTSDGNEFILHLEVQSTNDHKMAMRMAMSDLLTQAETGLEVKGFVIYIGKPKLKMKNEASFAGTFYSCTIVDIRTLDPQTFINSGKAEQVIYALLTASNDSDARPIIQSVLIKLQEMLGHSNLELMEMIIEMELLGQLRSKFIQQLIIEEVSNMPVILYKSKSLFYQEALRIGEKEGVIKGELRNKRSNALNLIQEGVSLDIISRSIGLSMDELLDLKQSSVRPKSGNRKNN